MVYRKSFWEQCPFREIQVAEDKHFYEAALSIGGVVAVNAGTMQIATVHQNNTSPRALNLKCYQEINV